MEYKSLTPDLIDPDIFSLVEPEIVQENLKQGKINHFICYLPLPNGMEKIELGDFIFDGKCNPRGKDVLACFDKDDLDAEVEALEHDAPKSTLEEFWEAYDSCRVDPYKLIWELLSPEASIYSLEMTALARENMKDIYGKAIF